MNEIEEYAFKKVRELSNINEDELLEIIDFLQKDRKQWIEQFTKTHNESIDLARKYNKALQLLSDYNLPCEIDEFNAKEENIDYCSQYYIQGSDHYLIPKDEFVCLLKEIKELQSQLSYLRSGEYYNQLRFERDMLQHVVDYNEVSKEDKEFIDMTHRNTELLEENQQLKADYGNKAQVERDLLLEEKQDLINYLKEKKEEFIKLYNISCDIIDFDRYECLKILCEEILSKIGENDK